MQPLIYAQRQVRSGHKKNNEESAINLIMQIGFSLCLASSVVFHVRLYQMNHHLREHYPSLWRAFGSGNEKLSLARQYYSMTKLTTEYRVNEPSLDEKFVLMRRLHQSGAIGAIVILVGITYELFV